MRVRGDDHMHYALCTLDVRENRRSKPLPRDVLEARADATRTRVVLCLCVGLARGAICRGGYRLDPQL